MSAEDVLRFLGRRLHGNLTGEVTTERRRRPEGARIKLHLKPNSVKVYDKATVLRVEIAINNPREFKIRRVTRIRRHRPGRWCPMGKGVANTWRYFQVGAPANQRYLEASAQAQPQRESIAHIDALCRSRIRNGRRHARLEPLGPADHALFAAVLAGEPAITGFPNANLASHLYFRPATSAPEARRRYAGVSRLIAKLRGHGLVAKVKGARLYCPTRHGLRVMSAGIHVRTQYFNCCPACCRLMQAIQLPKIPADRASAPG